MSVSRYMLPYLLFIAILSPQHAFGNYLFGICGSEKTDTDAVADCNAAIHEWMFKDTLSLTSENSEQYHRKGANAYYWRARAYDGLGQRGLAILDYTESLRLSKPVSQPFSVGRTALMGRAYSYFASGLYDSAIKDYTDLISTIRNPSQQASFYHIRGEAYFQMDRYGLALMDFNAGVAASPIHSGLYIARARLYTYMKEYDLAIADCSNVLQLYPDFGSAYLRRGIAYFSKHFDKLAEQDLTRSIELDPGEILGFYHRGILFEAQNRLEDAVRDWRSVLAFKAEMDNEREIQQATLLKLKTIHVE